MDIAPSPFLEKLDDFVDIINKTVEAVSNAIDIYHEYVRVQADLVRIESDKVLIAWNKLRIQADEIGMAASPARLWLTILGNTSQGGGGFSGYSGGAIEPLGNSGAAPSSVSGIVSQLLSVPAVGEPIVYKGQTIMPYTKQIFGNTVTVYNWQSPKPMFPFGSKPISVSDQNLQKVQTVIDAYNAQYPA